MDKKVSKEVERKSDVTEGNEEESSDDSEDEIGYYFVPETSKHGKANHEPADEQDDEDKSKLGEKFTKIDTTTVGSKEDTMRKKVFREKKVAEEVVNETLKTVPLHVDDETTITDTDSVQEETSEEETEEQTIDEETIEESVQEESVQEATVEETLNETDIESTTVKSTEDITTDETIDNDETRSHHNDRVDSKEKRVEKHRETKENLDKKTKKIQRKLPEAPSRRSERTKKPPDKYSDFHMYNVVQNRPYDSRFQALEAMMASGVLSSMDIDTARKVINAIMK